MRHKIYSYDSPKMENVGGAAVDKGAYFGIFYKRLNPEHHTYPSHFQQVNLIPTNKWVCVSRDSNEQWTCDTSTIDRG